MFQNIPNIYHSINLYDNSVKYVSILIPIWTGWGAGVGWEWRVKGSVLLSTSYETLGFTKLWAGSNSPFPQGSQMLCVFPFPQHPFRPPKIWFPGLQDPHGVAAMWMSGLQWGRRRQTVQSCAVTSGLTVVTLLRIVLQISLSPSSSQCRCNDGRDKKHSFASFPFSLQPAEVAWESSFPGFNILV